MKAIIGTTTTYHGTEHGYLNGYTVRIVGVFKGAARQDTDGDGAYLTNDEDIERAGGISSYDRIEVQPWLQREGRFSFATSDPLAMDLACLRQLNG